MPSEAETDEAEEEKKQMRMPIGIRIGLWLSSEHVS